MIPEEQVKDKVKGERGLAYLDVTTLLSCITLISKHCFLELSLPDLRAWRFLDLRLVPLIDAVLLWGTAYASWPGIEGAKVL